MQCFGGASTQRQIGSSKPTVRDIVRERGIFDIEQKRHDFAALTFFRSSLAFFASFAQEVNAQKGFSPSEIGVFGQDGVLKFSPSWSSAKSLFTLAESCTVSSSLLGHHLLFLGIDLAAIGICISKRHLS